MAYSVSAMFTICTECDLLKCDLNVAGATGRLAAWRLRLPEFELNVVHKSGIKNQASHSLLRLTAGKLDTAELHNDRIKMMVSSLEQGGQRGNNDHDVIFNNYGFVHSIMALLKP